MERRYSIQTKLAIGITALTVITSAVIIFSLFWFVRTRTREQLRQRLIDVASVAALQIDTDLHATLIDPEQEGNQEYEQIQTILEDIHGVSADITYVYTMRWVDGDIVFVVDADVDESEIAHLGEIYEDPEQEIVDHMANPTAPWADQEFTTDKWGSWLSAYAPLVTSDGEVDAVLGVDMAVEDVLENEQPFFWISLASFLLVVPLSSWLGWQLGKRLTDPLIALNADVERIASGDLDHRASITTRDEVGQLAAAFNKMADQASSLVYELESRVSTRTQQLEQHNRNLETTALLSRSISTILDQEELISQAVERIRARFNLYYVGLFIVDEARESAVLQAGTGAAGEAMLARGHRIKIGQGSVGWSIANAQPRVVQVASEDDVRLATPELPETRSEAALPLRSRGQVLGAISVQSDRANAFDEQTITVLQVMAEQVAIAIDNARLYAESQSALEAERRAYGEVSRRAWEDIDRSRPKWGPNWGYHYTSSGILSDTVARVEGDWNPEMDQAAQSGKTVLGETGLLAIPIKVRDQVVGVLSFQRASGAAVDGKLDSVSTSEIQHGTDGKQRILWSRDEILTLEAIIAQVGEAMDSARLYTETQRRAERERLAGEITAKMRASNDPQTILQTAVQELRQALQVKHAQVFVHTQKPNQNETAPEKDDHPSDDDNNSKPPKTGE